MKIMYTDYRTYKEFKNHIFLSVYNQQQRIPDNYFNK